MDPEIVAYKRNSSQPSSCIGRKKYLNVQYWEEQSQNTVAPHDFMSSYVPFSLQSKQQWDHMETGACSVKYLFYPTRYFLTDIFVQKFWEMFVVRLWPAPSSQWFAYLSGVIPDT